MPTYEFYNQETCKVEEHFMSYKNLDDFKAKHPNLIRVINPTMLSNPDVNFKVVVEGNNPPNSFMENRIINLIKSDYTKY